MSVYDVWVRISREEVTTVVADSPDEAEEKAKEYFEDHERGDAEVEVTGIACNLEQ